MPSARAYLLMTNVSPTIWRAPVIERPQLIGRLIDCQIVVPSQHRQVSRLHAKIRSRNDEIWIEDMNSTGGTQLNGVPLSPGVETITVIGDRLSLGGLEIHLVSPQAAVLREISIARLVAQSPGAKSVKLNWHQSSSMESYSYLRELTPSEIEIVRWIDRGMKTFDELGRQLFRSPHTVRTQLNTIYKKLNVHSREELLALLRRCENAWTQPKLTKI